MGQQVTLVLAGSPLTFETEVRVEACKKYKIGNRFPPGPCRKVLPEGAEEVADSPKPKAVKKAAPAKKATPPPPAPPAPAPPAKKAVAKKAAPKASPAVTQAPVSPEVAAAQQHVTKLAAKLPPALRKEVTEELMAQAAKTPKAMQKLKAIGFGVRPAGVPPTPGGAQYYPENRSIELNAGWRTNRAFWDKEMGDSLADGYLTPTGSRSMVGATVAHEFGHHVAMRSYDPRDIGLRAPKGERILRAVASAAGVAPPKGTGRGFWSWADIKAWQQANRGSLRAATSEYGGDSFHETLAEAWQEYSTRGEAARPFARQVGRLLQTMAEA